MDIAGPNSGYTASNDTSSSSNLWSDLSYCINGSEYDSKYTQYQNTSLSAYLKLQDFRFEIPEENEVKGISISINWLTEGGISYVDEVRIVKNGSIGSTNKASPSEQVPSSLTFSTYGSDSDLWGETWAIEDINSPDTGIAIAVHGSNGFCFIADTKISTFGGYVNIQDIHVGDAVLSFDENLNLIYNNVSEVVKYENVRMEFVTFKTINGSTLTLSNNHRVLTTSGFKSSKDLRIGDIIYKNIDNNIIQEEISTLDYKIDTLDVYDIEVENTHTFIADDILVHNFIPLISIVDVDFVEMTVYHEVIPPPTSRPFAFNTGSVIADTQRSGYIVAGSTQATTELVDTVRWWNGPNENLGYVIAHTVSGGNQPNPDSESPCYIAFWRSKEKTDESFLELSNSIRPVREAMITFSENMQAYEWLYDNGYWTSAYYITPSATWPDSGGYIYNEGQYTGYWTQGFTTYSVSTNPPGAYSIIYESSYMTITGSGVSPVNDNDTMSIVSTQNVDFSLYNNLYIEYAWGNEMPLFKLQTQSTVESSGDYYANFYEIVSNHPASVLQIATFSVSSISDPFYIRIEKYVFKQVGYAMVTKMWLD